MRRKSAELLQELSNRQFLSPMRSESHLCEVFHENTKLSRANSGEYSRIVTKINNEPKLKEMLSHPYKVYSYVDQRVGLPRPEPDTDLSRTIMQRRSRRRFDGSPVTLQELGRLLGLSYGETGEPPLPKYFRAAPSGGALYPLELYVIALNVEGLEPGIYHYNVEQHAADQLKPGDYRQQISELLFSEGVDMENASLAVIYTAILHRNVFKYQDRGYRMILMEAGAAAENLHLAGVEMGLSCVWLGGFYDDELAALLDIDSVGEPPLLPIVIGRQQTSSP